MKKIVKVLSMFVMVLVLTGCLSIDYRIRIIDKDNAEVKMDLLFAKEILDQAQMNEDDFIAQMKENKELNGWQMQKKSKKIKGEDYVGIVATAPKDVAKEILNGLEVKGNTYTLTLPSADLGGTEELSQITGSEYSIEDLKNAGMDMCITFEMPGEIKKANVGKITDDNTVKLEMADFMELDKDIVIVSQESSSSNLMLYLGIGVVVVVIAGGYFLMKKKKETSEVIEDDIE